MNMSRRIRPLLLALCLSVVAACAGAQPQPQNQSYEPRVGQQGKDVVWVPTPQELVDKMLDMAKVTPKDYLIDLGSGDGRTVITAAKRGLRARGIEYNPDMVALSKRNANNEGVSERAQFVKADIFESDLSNATVITMFLLTEINLKLRPKLLDLKPGTRIVSNTFTMGAWSADRIVIAEQDCEQYCVAHFWIVPAKVAGRWRMTRGEMELHQTFQIISGTLKTASGVVEITNGRLEGTRIDFSAGDADYVGLVSGDRIDGIFRSPSGEGKWGAALIADH